MTIIVDTDAFLPPYAYRRPADPVNDLLFSPVSTVFILALAFILKRFLPSFFDFAS